MHVASRLSRTTRIAPFTLHSEQALDKLAEYLAGPNLLIPWSWVKVVRCSSTYLPFFLVKSRAKGMYSLNVREIKVLSGTPKTRGIVGGGDPSLSESTTKATTERIDQEFDSGDTRMQWYCGDPKVCPAARVLPLRSAELPSRLIVPLSEWRETVDEICPIAAGPTGCRGKDSRLLRDAAEVTKRSLVTHLKKKNTPDLNPLDAKAEVTVSFSTFQLEIQSIELVYVPCHRIDMNYDSSRHTFVVCGSTGTVSAPFIINPFYAGRRAALGTLLGGAMLCKGLDVGVVSAAIGLPVMVGVAFSAATAYTRRSLMRRFPTLAARDPIRPFQDSINLSSSELKAFLDACEVLQVPTGNRFDLDLQEIRGRMHAAVLRAYVDKDKQMEARVTEAYRALRYFLQHGRLDVIKA